MKRNRRATIAGVAAMTVLAVLVGAGFQSNRDLFQKALQMERTEGNLKEATALFEKVVAQAGEDEALAAQAQLRIGFCFEKLGLREAQKAFQAVIDKYPKQAENDHFISWSPDKNRMIFLSDRTGKCDLWSVNWKAGRIEGDPTILNPDIGMFSPITCSRNGSLFFYLRNNTVDIYEAGIDVDNNKVISRPRRIGLLPMGNNDAPSVSPDGQTIAYQTNRGPRTVLPGTKIDTVAFYSLTSKKQWEFRISRWDIWNVGMPQWASGGDAVFFQARESAEKRFYNLYKMNVQNGEVRLIVAGSEKEPFFRSLAADGNTLFYGLSGTLYRKNLLNNETREISRGESRRPFITRLSPDEKYLAAVEYLKLDKDRASELTILPVEGGGPRLLLRNGDLPGKPHFYHSGWSSDGKYVLLTTMRGQNPRVYSIWFVPRDGTSPRKFDLDLPDLRWPSYDPATKRLIFSSAAMGETEIWTLENFLPKK